MIPNKNIYNNFSSILTGTKYNIPFLINQPGTGKNNTLYRIISLKLRTSTGNQIAGEIYSIDDKMLSRLDLLEDYPSFYDRKLMNIECNNDQILCWVYILNKFPKELQNLPLISDYNNTPELCYQKSCQHVSNILSD